ncbi:MULTISPECIES: CCA tRNA nucleotidyltransferase [Paracoccus]|uniref:CCA tRNA nucleotidyltransferase n=1 Tax=Paracoccus TaxID=265 RepID=UPI00086BE446|nr:MULTISPECIES: CCA tRNA nucleotidyltransferase [Paracoccus]ODT59650.1 MAG: poly(A) polymerase [Paracoccus sp. SCN 68-21]
MTRLPDHILSDPALMRVLDALTAQGDRALLVGGAVRNALLGQPIDDIDIATDAPPQRTVALARAAGLRAVPTGIDHGTVTLVASGRGFEVTTFRRDVETDGRHAVVAFSTDLAEDAARRDFTMNALYADRDGTVIDPMGGLPDLAARRLRFVGGPDARIAEDYLRILRFFRFFARYGHQADPAAVAACAVHRDGLSRIARERIGAELKKLLAAPDPGPAVGLMAQTGVLAVLLPDATPDRLAALLAAEPMPGGWLRRLAALCTVTPDLRLSRADQRALNALQRARGWSLDEAAFRMGADLATDHALLVAADGHPLPADWQARIARGADAPLPIAATDLAPLQGPALGRALKAAEAAWIASAFTLPAPALIDGALMAGKDPT